MAAKKKTKVRIVLDTNILISALLFEGELSKIVDLCKNGTITPVFSRETFKEFKQVLAYPKFVLSQDEIEVLIEEEILPFSEVTNITEEVRGVCRAPDDDKFLSCAVSTTADLIISGDSHLLKIKEFKRIPIMKVSEFFRWLNKV
jgi:putative PIN family toxin of toxin-antitoxin system